MRLSHWSSTIISDSDVVMGEKETSSRWTRKLCREGGHLGSAKAAAAPVTLRLIAEAEADDAGDTQVLKREATEDRADVDAAAAAAAAAKREAVELRFEGAERGRGM